MTALKPEQWNFVSVKEPNEPRLDLFLAQTFSELSRTSAQRLIVAEQVKVNGLAARASLKLQVGDQVALFWPRPRPTEILPQDIPLHILYQDSELAVIEKPAGLVVHPSAGHADQTLVNALLHHIGDLSSGSGVGGELRPGIVHRIDRFTSGVLLVTKTDAAHRALTTQFKEHSITRHYFGLCWGSLPAQGEWNEAIGRDPKERKRMALVPEGRKALTKFRALEKMHDALTFFRAELFTGRTHQIRVHFATHGYPLAGDPLYGAATRAARLQRERGGKSLHKRSPETAALLLGLEERGRQFLHAAHLGFTHPASGERMEFQSELPADLQEIMLSWRACQPPPPQSP